MLKGAELNKCVLVVEDEEKILNFMRLKLKASGYQVIIATNGQAGLDLVKSVKPDVILLDIIMPIMDGFEMLRKLRAFSEVPVIVITARSSSGDKAIRLGATDYIDKPFKPDELMKKIEFILNRYGEPATPNTERR